jgi:replicative DNA helicase
MYEQYNYPPEYQDAILACLVSHPEKFMPYQGIFNSAYFTGVERIATARALFGYWRKNARFPIWQTLSQIVYDAIARTSEEKDASTITEYVQKLREMDTGDADDIARHCIEWARRRALYLAIDHAATSFQAGDVPADGFIPMFQEALKVGNNIEDLGYIIGPGENNDIAKVIAEYTKEGYALSSGFNLLDELLPARGFEPGWLISILAPPKRYKTTFCINLALNIAAGGRPVFYYPCEITQKLAAIRTLCRLTDRSVDFIRNNPKGFTDLALREAREIMGADLLIKGYPSKGCTISGDIRAHAMNSRQQLGIEPAAIFIDFAETVRSSADPKRTSEHRAQGEIYIEARALASEMNCPVFMPDRCNKETVEKTVPSMASFQGSFEKAGIVDLGIGLCASDQEALDHIIRYFIFLNRHGEASQHFRGTVEPKTYRMSVDEKIPWNPEEEENDNRGGYNRGGGRKRGRPRCPPPDEIEA